jgi:hypothetical protein
MAFTKFTQYRKRGTTNSMRIRFTGGVAYLSAGLIQAASAILRKEGTLEEHEDIQFVELFFDRDTQRVAVKPVGHKGLKPNDVKNRPGVRQVTGTKSKTVSVRGFQEEFAIQDRTVFELQPETHQNRSLPAAAQQFILFVSSSSSIEP